MRSFYAADAPPTVRAAALVQALEAAGLCVAAVFQVIEAVSGHSYQESSGIALAVLEVLTAVLLAWIASAVATLRPWGRTPGVMTQICVALLALILLQSRQYAWGVPALVLAIAGLVAFFHPATLKALRRPAPDKEEPAAKPSPARKPPPAGKPSPAGKAAPAKSSSGKPASARKTQADGAKRK